MMDKNACETIRPKAKKIYLTRHGESMYNTKNLIGGDTELSAKGQQYAKELVQVLSSRLPKDLEETGETVIVYTSMMVRTIQTAKGIPYSKKRFPELNEINAGICEGLTYEQIAEKWPEEFEARKKDKLRYRYPEGESYLDLVDRVRPVAEQLQEEESEYVVVVAHQAIARILYGYLTGMPLDDLPALDMPLHTLFEFTRQEDGTYIEDKIDVHVPTTTRQLTFRELSFSLENLSLSPRASIELSMTPSADLGKVAV